MISTPSWINAAIEQLIQLFTQKCLDVVLLDYQLEQAKDKIELVGENIRK